MPMEVSSSVSLSTSRAIFDDAERAHDDPSHPCHSFVDLQHGVDPSRWQMPIPFMGTTAAKGLVFLGLNPSYDPNEESPRWGVSFEEWDGFWRRAFESRTVAWPHLYQWYQRIGVHALGDAFQLGRDALVLEVIRYRSEKSQGCDEPEVLLHEMPVTLQLLKEVRPSVLLCSGSKVLWRIREWLPGLVPILPADYRMKDVEGKVLRCESPWGPVAIIGARHLTGGYGWSAAARLALGDAVREALKSPTFDERRVDKATELS